VHFVGSKDRKPIKHSSLKDCKLQIQYTVTDLRIIKKKQTGLPQETGCEEMDLSHLVAIRVAPGCCEHRNESLALIIVCIAPKGGSIPLQERG